MRGLRFGASAFSAALLAVATFAPGAVPVAAAQGTAAADGPGALSHFDLARKDCIGTARNTTSKVWFTVANGVLSDVYSPTIDNTNVSTLRGKSSSTAIGWGMMCCSTLNRRNASMVFRLGATP